MPSYAWDVFLPSEDIPQRITTDFLLSAGEEIIAGGGTWTVERVEIDESIEPATGIVTVVAPQEPTLPPPRSSVPPPPK